MNKKERSQDLIDQAVKNKEDGAALRWLTLRKRGGQSFDVEVALKGVTFPTPTIYIMKAILELEKGSFVFSDLFSHILKVIESNDGEIEEHLFKNFIRNFLLFHLSRLIEENFVFLGISGEYNVTTNIRPAYELRSLFQKTHNPFSKEKGNISWMIKW